jgi:hypothetical protein
MMTKQPLIQMKDIVTHISVSRVLRTVAGRISPQRQGLLDNAFEVVSWHTYRAP